jgi:hypothetical protein
MSDVESDAPRSSSASRAPSSRTRSMSLAVFIPLLMMALTLLIQVFYQNTQLRREREILDAQWNNQRTTLEEAQKLRTQLQSIAGATAILAEQGNQNAIQIRDQLRAQGVTIQPPQPPAPEG